jgi:hypothetical protein
MSPNPTYGDRAKNDRTLPDENDAARRSKHRTTRDDPKTDAEIDPATLKPEPSRQS